MSINTTAVVPTEDGELTVEVEELNEDEDGRRWYGGTIQESSSQRFEEGDFFEFERHEAASFNVGPLDVAPPARSE